MIKLSFRFKVILAFLIASLTPYMLVSLFLFYEMTSALREKVTDSLHAKGAVILHEVTDRFYQLQTQLRQWSKLQIMDDLLVDDVDKRIARFLTSAMEELDVSGHLLCINADGMVIASSSPSLIGKRLEIEERFIKLFGEIFLVLKAEIFSSFDEKMKVGELVLLLSTSNIERSLRGETYVALLNPEAGMHLGSLPLNIDLKNLSGLVDTGEHLFLMKKVDNEILGPGWVLVLGVEKERAFKPIYNLAFILVTSSLAGALSIVALSVLFSSRALKPIEEVVQLADYIVRTRDYSRRVPVRGEDEISLLSESINRLLDEVQNALAELERESLNRLRLFKHLVDMFSLIMSQDEEEKLLKTAVEELREFLGIEVELLSKPREGGKNYELKVRRLKGETLERETVGFLFFNIGKAPRELEDFLNAVVGLISFQLERLSVLKLERVLREKAQSASRAKSLFIANMSHELRTPLNAIIGFAQYIKDDPDTPDRIRELAGHIETSGRHLLAIINDILDISKAEAGKLKVEPRDINLGELLEKVEVMVSPSAEQKGLRLRIEKPALKVKTDPKILTQILINLLSNSIKYTEKGKIELKVEKLSGFVKFRVIDTGIGIPKEFQSRIFEAFYQVNTGGVGAGLGLALTKKLVEALGGEIGVYSEGKGKGSEFWFTIPIR